MPREAETMDEYKLFNNKVQKREEEEEDQNSHLYLGPNGGEQIAPSLIPALIESIGPVVYPLPLN
jgi:hypothetical protein